MVIPLGPHPDRADGAAGEETVAGVQPEQARVTPAGLAAEMPTESGDLVGDGQDPPGAVQSPDLKQQREERHQVDQTEQLRHEAEGDSGVREGEGHGGCFRARPQWRWRIRAEIVMEGVPSGFSRG